MSKLRDIMKDREAWCAVVLGVTKSQAMPDQLNNSKVNKFQLTRQKYKVSGAG